jgi:hypothetical protein
MVSAAHESFGVRTRPASPVRWLATVGEYASAAAVAAPDEPVPVLRPSRPEQEQAWRGTIDRLFGPVAGDVAGERLVLAWGPAAADAARVFAAVTRSRLVFCRSEDDVVAQSRGGAEENVVVAGFAHQLTVAAVARITAAAGGPLGFLCGRDQAALSFAVAKALLRPAAALTGTTVLDAPSHRSEENPDVPADELRRRLTEPSLVQILRSHGEGGHAKYGRVVVCGLLDVTEFPATPDSGCAREPRVCKRAEPLGADVVFGAELAAPVVFFLCCNGFNVAQELYPSPVSMALALLEGPAGAVIAPSRPLVVPDTLLTALREELAHGTSLGRIVTELNRLSAELGQRDAFVLLGDPCLTVPAADQNLPPADDRTTGSSVLDDLQDWLIAVLRHAERGRRLIRSARIWLAGRADELLVPAAQRADEIERLALYALKWTETRPSGESLVRLRRNATMIRMSVSRWDNAVARLLLQVRDTADAFDIGHYDQVLVGVSDGDPCARCDTPTEVHLFGRGEPLEHHRRAHLCRVCGPVGESGTSGPALVVSECPAVVHGGGRLRIGADLRFPPGARRVVGNAQVYLRFFDKARDRCVHDEIRVVAAEDQAVEFDIDLPVDLGVDLHSVRLVVVSGFDVGYARARVAALPRAGAEVSRG